jgi:hypothetical protein
MACSGPTEEEPTAEPFEEPIIVEGCVTGTAMSEIPEMPSGVLLQSVLISEEGETSGYRIYEDGRYETKAIQENWSFGEPLTGDQVEAVKAIIAEARFDRLSEHYQPEQVIPNANTLWMQVNDAGERFDVELVDSCEVPAITALSGKIVDLFR